jgi:hypothetical protein
MQSSSAVWQLYMEPRPVPWMFLLYLAVAGLLGLLTALKLWKALGLSSGHHDSFSPESMKALGPRPLSDIASLIPPLSPHSPEGILRTLSSLVADEGRGGISSALVKADLVFRFRIVGLRKLIGHLRTLFGVTILVSIGWIISRLSSFLGAISSQKETDLWAAAELLREIVGPSWWAVAALLFLYVLHRHFEERILKREARWNLLLQISRDSEV